jgi:hypothetical protein
MINNIALNNMTIEEKIQTMETIWEDLCKTAESVISPEWHINILNEREEQIKSGKAEFINWETAKKNIRDSI